MKKITSPLEPGQQGARVADLQDALLFLLDKAIIFPDDESARRELTAALARDRRTQSYGDSTAKVVANFQQQQQLESSGQVDAPTAALLNNFLRQFGVLEENEDGWAEVVRTLEAQGQTLSAINQDTHHLEQIDTKIGRLGAGPALSLHSRGEEVRSLHQQLTDLGLALPQAETGEAFFGVGTRDALLQLQATYHLARTGVLDDATRNALAIALGNVAHARRLEGRIFLDNGLPAAKIKLRIVHKGFGQHEASLGEVETDERGFYALPYEANGTPANLEVRALDVQGAEVRLSTPKVRADRSAVVNLVAPAALQSQANEFQLLAADLAPVVGQDLADLGQAQESATRRDVTLLHQATSWDARLIATAATAAKVNALTGIGHDALYGALRAGLPEAPEALAQVSPEAFETALRRASEAGVVGLDAARIAAAKTAFEDFALQARRQAIVPGALSSTGELLDGIALEAGHRQVFEKLVLLHEGSDAALWTEARAQGLPAETVASLQLQGKLAYLTLNNAPLTASLLEEIQLPENLGELVEKDLYRPEAWISRLQTLAGGTGEVDPEQLAKLIPAAYKQAALPDRLQAYAADMAQQVRQGYPTQVVSRLLDKDELNLGQRHAELREPVQTFLHQGMAAGFQLGRTPVSAFLKQHGETVLAGMSEPDKVRAEDGVKLLTRAYQMSPNDETMTTLLDLGFTAARQVVAIPRADFVERYWERFGSRKATETVYDKSVQISSVTFNLYTLAKKVESTPPVLALSGSPERQAEAKEDLKSLLKEYPTMETLFGSLDFCECEHCRSVLSPAAYLVDLLRFVDPGPSDWQHSLDDWKQKHGGKAYDGPDYQLLKPYDALMLRRADLPHLALTCENTNTALPYIDLVNEILEYFVAHKNLNENAAYDTGNDSSAELLAEPQHLIPEAYELLKTARYPLHLPFDLWLETLRRVGDYFDTPLWQLLEVFRPADELFAPPVDPEPYYRNQIYAEYLGLSTAEYAIFTAPDLSDWPTLYGYESGEETQALAELKSAKTLAQKLGISYQELSEVIQTAFVNPRLPVLVTLRKLGLEVSQVFRYKKHPDYLPLPAEEEAELEKRLAALTDKFKPNFDAQAWLEDAWAAGDFDQVLVLRDPDASGASFDETTLAYAGAAASGLEVLDLVKINYLVRLWKRLGWTLEETDDALQTFLPAGLPLTAASLGQALQTALVYLAHFKELHSLLGGGKGSRIRLLTLWANLPTRGKNPLYAQLFLTRSIKKEDAFFDHPLGLYLSTPGLLLQDHLPALQAALGLSADEIARILGDGNTGPESELATATLSLANVSLLYRYGQLAKALKLPVRDLIVLKALSGLDPFHPLAAEALTDSQQDYPASHTLAFVRAARQLSASTFTLADLDYLFRHHYEVLGPYRDKPEAQLAWIRTLAASLGAIARDFALPDQPGSLSDEDLRQKMALVFAPEVVEKFMVFWQDSFAYTAVKPEVPEDNQLDPNVYGHNGVSVAYDEVRHLQQLTHVGVLTDSGKTALLAQIPVPRPTDLKALAMRQLYTDLLEEVQLKSSQLFREFFDTYFDGLLVFDDFFGPGADPDPAVKRRQLLARVLPFLQARLVRQAVLQALETQTAADPALTEALLTDPALLALPDTPAEPLLTHLAALAQRGLSAAFFASPDLSDLPASTPRVQEVTVAAGENTQSARWRGFLEVPQSGTYRFYARLGLINARVNLRFDSQAEALLEATATLNQQELSAAIELRSGVLYGFTWEAANLQNGSFSLLVKGETTSKTSLAGSPLLFLPQAAADQASAAYTLLAKAGQLNQGLGFSARELRHVLRFPADFGQADWSLLPTRASAPDDAGAAAAAVALFRGWQRGVSYAALRQQVAGEELISVFEAARKTEPETVAQLCQRLAGLTRRDPATVQATAAELQMTSADDFADSARLERLWQALQLLGRLGLSLSSLKAWLGPQPDAGAARQVRHALKARFEPEAWQRVAPVLFDPLRQAKRDALVAYIRQLRPELSSTEKVFEYFLVDPGTEPVVQTSRLRLAISSLQTFIQRCFLNLEKQVHPSMLNARHWAWMKRYRVWEANRKIFLYPENWLEPEWRDDKTHLYQELESSLLQGDVTNQLAEDALYVYLRKLDQLARLEIVTMYTQEQTFGPPTLHVIGRTYALPRQYFYRRYANRMWTPWEPVNAEVDGDHLAVVVWRERLHLFWLSFQEKVAESAAGPGTSQTGALGSMGFNTLLSTTTGISQAAGARSVEVQLHWSEYEQGEWTVRQSGGFGHTAPLSGPFNPAGIFIALSKETDPETGQDGALHIQLKGLSDVTIQGRGSFGYRFRVVSKNSHPTAAVDRVPASAGSPFQTSGTAFNRYTGSGKLAVSFVQQVITTDGESKAAAAAPQTILAKAGPGAYTLLAASNQAKFPNAEFAPLISPVFYADETYTFFVEPSLTETTVDKWEGYTITRPSQKPRWDEYVAQAKPISPLIPPKYLQEALPLSDLQVSPDPIDPVALHAFKPNLDAFTQPGTAVRFGDALIGSTGGLQEPAPTRVITNLADGAPFHL
ncbi:MAG: neuraminidase-like domain-containing protein [Adhaeribacter sp.]